MDSKYEQIKERLGIIARYIGAFCWVKDAVAAGYFIHYLPDASGGYVAIFKGNDWEDTVTVPSDLMDSSIEDLERRFSTEASLTHKLQVAQLNQNKQDELAAFRRKYKQLEKELDNSVR